MFVIEKDKLFLLKSCLKIYKGSNKEYKSGFVFLTVLILCTPGGNVKSRVYSEV